MVRRRFPNALSREEADSEIRRIAPELFRMAVLALLRREARQRWWLPPCDARFGARYMRTRDPTVIRSSSWSARIANASHFGGSALSTDSSWKAIMQYSFLVVFANDETIDARELGMLMRLALKDREVDEHERVVLSSIFARVTREKVAADVWEEIGRFKSRYQIP